MASHNKKLAVSPETSYHFSFTLSSLPLTLRVLSGGRVSGDALRSAGGGGHAAAERDVAAARRPAAAEEPRARAGREHHHRHAAPPGLRHLPVCGVQRGKAQESL